MFPERCWMVSAPAAWAGHAYDDATEQELPDPHRGGSRGRSGGSGGDNGAHAAIRSPSVDALRRDHCDMPFVHHGNKCKAKNPDFQIPLTICNPETAKKQDTFIYCGSAASGNGLRARLRARPIVPRTSAGEHRLQIISKIPPRGENHEKIPSANFRSVINLNFFRNLFANTAKDAYLWIGKKRIRS